MSCELRGKPGNKLKELDRTGFCKPIKGLQGLGDCLCTEWSGWKCFTDCCSTALSCIIWWTSTLPSPWIPLKWRCSNICDGFFVETWSRTWYVLTAYSVPYFPLIALKAAVLTSALCQFRMNQFCPTHLVFWYMNAFNATACGIPIAVQDAQIWQAGSHPHAAWPYTFARCCRCIK